MDKEKLRQIVDGSDTKASRIFDISVQVLIIISLIEFSVETLPDLSTLTRQVLAYVEAITVGFFTLEYVLRIVAAERKFRFIFSFFGIIDLLSILPFYLAIGFDFRSLRALRLFRLFRILKLVRYSTAIRRFHCALMIAKEELVLYLILTVLLLFLSATGIYYCEREAQPEEFSSVFHSLWWVVATLTTVGYGDIYPVTTGGRLFTFVVLLAGLGVVSVPSGLVASALSKARELELDAPEDDSSNSPE